MTTASTDGRSPRRRQSQLPVGQSGLSPKTLSLLQIVGVNGIASLPQLAAFGDLSEQSARRGMRVLKEIGLVYRIRVPRVALADATAVNDASLVFGSAPGIYSLTRAGLKALEAAGLAESMQLVPQRYGPRNTMFLAHELGVRDARVWFERSARRYPTHLLAEWHYAAAAEVDLRRAQPPRFLRPDARLRYDVGDRPLHGFLEWDRGTERGSHRWQEKLTAYQIVFAGPLLKQATGASRARILIFTADARRRDQLATLIAAHAPSSLADRCWLVDESIRAIPDVFHSGWRRAGSQELCPLIDPALGQTAPTTSA